MRYMLGTALVMDDHDYCIDSSTLSMKPAENIDISEISAQSSSGTDGIESLGKQVESNLEAPCTLSTSNNKSIITGMLRVFSKYNCIPFLFIYFL